MLNILSRFYEILSHPEEEYQPWLFLGAVCMAGGAFAYYQLTTRRNTLASYSDSQDLEANRNGSGSGSQPDKEIPSCDQMTTQQVKVITRQNDDKANHKKALTLLDAFSKLSHRDQKFVYRMCRLQPMLIDLMDPNSAVSKWVSADRRFNPFFTELTLTLLSSGLRNPEKMNLYKEGIRLLPNLNLMEFLARNPEIRDALSENLSNMEGLYGYYLKHLTSETDPELINAFYKMHMD